MPDTRTHRGADPRDGDAFGPIALPSLREAVSHLSWLLGRGYSITSALKLVGDRWSLTERQRLAVRRSACSEQSLARRISHQVSAEMLKGRSLVIDGFNVVTTVEAAFGGGLVLHCRDGTFRDLAGIHGTYRKVAETIPTLMSIGESLASLEIALTHWLFDRPVSNSGRIREILLKTAAERGWNWNVELIDNPDPILKESTEIVATADSAILDRCEAWFNLARTVVEAHCPSAWIVDLAV